jgi:hypothetical protein
MAKFVKAAATGEIPPGKGKLVEGGGKKISALQRRRNVLCD